MSAAQHPTEIYKVGLGSVRYLLAVGDLLIGWRLLVQAGIAHAALANGPARERRALLSRQDRGCGVLRQEHASETELASGHHRVHRRRNHAPFRSLVLNTQIPHSSSGYTRLSGPTTIGETLISAGSRTPRLARLAIFAVTGVAALSIAACSSSNNSSPTTSPISPSTGVASPTTTSSAPAPPNGESQVRGLIASVAGNAAQVTQQNGQRHRGFHRIDQGH